MTAVHLLSSRTHMCEPRLLGENVDVSTCPQFADRVEALSVCWTRCSEWKISKMKLQASDSERFTTKSTIVDFL